ncbi:MAG TPA: hypothetical protein VFX49_23115 [Chloroflexota bacterium]|nr:hypothetical protein [Chloroflexota bacterium]
MLPRSHPLTGAADRVDRANEHLQALYAEARDFIKPETYRVVPMPYFRKAKDRTLTLREMRSRGIPLDGFGVRRLTRNRFAVRYLMYEDASCRFFWNTPPDERRWGIVVGEAIQNLRIALDYVACELTLETRRRLGKRAPKVRDDNIAFPILLTPHSTNGKTGKVTKGGEWKRVTRGQGAIAGVPRRVQAMLKKLQPFYRRKPPAAAEGHPLWLLRTLSNRDKHRAISVVSFAGEALQFKIRFLDPDAASKPPRIRDLWRREFGPLVDDTEVARLRFFHEVPFAQLAALGEVPMQVYHRFRVEVAFGEGTPVAGQLVLDVLNPVSHAVDSVIEAFKSVFR